jgi:ribonuclease III
MPPKPLKKRIIWEGAELIKTKSFGTRIGVDIVEPFGYTHKIMVIMTESHFPMDDAYRQTLAELELVIGYAFKDPLLLCQAMTHRSFVNEASDRRVKENERLEFFGDAILDFFLSDRLYRRFPESREGDLTRIRASLVDEESLAQLAGRLDLGKYLRLGKGEEKSGGRGKRSILADAYEALVAAVYLDGGTAVVQALLEAHFSPLIERHGSGMVSRDYKTEFQELSQAIKGVTPRYLLKDSSGPDHDRVFRIEALIGADCYGEGVGRSKKEAEQAAAREGYARLKGLAGEVS